MSVTLPPLGQFTESLVQEGLITKEQLAVAKVSQENLGEDLANILVKKGFVNEEQLLDFLSRHLNIPFISLKQKKPDPELLRDISVATAKRLVVIPLRRNKTKVEVAMANPLDSFVMDDLKATFKQEIIPFLASPLEIQKAIEKAYEIHGAPDEEGSIGVVETMGEKKTFEEMESKKIQEIASGHKVIAAVNNLISKAWKENASDIHIEPYKQTCRVRYRVDGILQERGFLARNLHFAIVSRMKIMASLDIAEHRVPQDGRVQVLLVGRPLDLRVSTCPTQFGEKIVLRLLFKETVRNVEDLGFNKEHRRIFSEIMSKKHGIFLSTGPTGSGKSTTLYAALTRLNSPELNIISIEDPIESEIEGINQIAVSPKVGLTFATILRSVLRQDPDVIMIGEIRDAETAQIAVRAAITGHLVLSTLHTNTAAGAISRLMDLGVEPFLLSSALQGVVGQRLVRKICSKCQEQIDMEKEKLGPYAQMVSKVFRGKGCPHCHFTGYSGRIGIFEMAPINEKISQLIYNRAPEAEIEKELRAMGLEDMRKDGFRKIEEGLTTLEEVLRVTEEE